MSTKTALGPGRSGYRIEADTEREMQAVVDGLLARYPANPYGTFVSWRGEFGGKWVAIVEGISTRI